MEGNQEVAQLWKECLDEAKARIPTSFVPMIAPLWPLSLQNGTLKVGVPSPFAKDFIESRFTDTLNDILSSKLGYSAKVVLTVSSPPEITESIAAGARIANVDEQEEPVIRERPAHGHDFHQKRYSFDNFVVGDSNKFAYNASLMVAEAPGQYYNPLFMHGGTGLGKTHLLLAIKDYAEKLNPEIKVRYVLTSLFIDDFIATATLKKDKAAFDQKYINNKIILFDDVHSLSGTEATQNKFFEIFNLLYSSNSHIVLTSDRPPEEIPKLSDRIKSRFQGGLKIDIKPPDIETRLAILRMKARAERVEMPDDAMLFIATKAVTNIRSLEGLFNQVVAYARVYGMKIDLQMVKERLRDQPAEPNQLRTPTVETIQNLVSDYYKIEKADLTGSSRSRALVHGRHVAMYLCRELTNETLISIGSKFGGRDHSTVLHSCRKIESKIRESSSVLEEVRELTSTIHKTT